MFLLINKEHNGVVAVDVKWKSGVHFIVYQTLWHEYYYVMRNNEQISNAFHVGKHKKDFAIYIQRLINDINNGRYDNKMTPRELHLKDVQQKGLTGYMNNRKWNKIFDIIRSIEEKTGKEISIMYKYISDVEDPACYWSIRGDEEKDFLTAFNAGCEFVYINDLIKKYFIYKDEFRIKSRGGSELV